MSLKIVLVGYLVLIVVVVLLATVSEASKPAPPNTCQPPILESVAAPSPAGPLG